MPVAMPAAPPAASASSSALEPGPATAVPESMTEAVAANEEKILSALAPNGVVNEIACAMFDLDPEGVTRRLARLRAFRARELSRAQREEEDMARPVGKRRMV
jgi:hypothetical protein